MLPTFGQFTKQPDGYAIRFERHLHHPIQRVWEAITRPEQLAIWFTDIEMDFRPGGEMKIWFRDEARTETQGRILRIEPPHLFEWNWEEELATWELKENGNDACVLVLTYSKLPPADYLLSVPAGFDEMLIQLESVLAGRTEPYPFDGNTTPHQRYLQSAYTSLILEQYPELQKKEEHPPVIVEKDMDAPAEKIWTALTDPEQMKQWYFDLPGFRPEVGYTFEFWGGTEENQYRHLSQVTEVVPLKRIQYSWRYDGYEGDSLVTFDIFPVGRLTRVKVTHSGLETFPPIADFVRTNFEAGWTDFIGRLLPDFVTHDPK